MFIYKILISVLLTFFFLAQGCVIIPVPEQCVSGEEVTKNELTSITPCITTKVEILDILGKPNIIWLDENIFAYNWKMVWAIMPWVVAAGYQAAGGVEELTKEYVLLIQFDQNERVARFERIKRSMFTSYGELLENWTKQDNETSSENNSRKK